MIDFQKIFEFFAAEFKTIGQAPLVFGMALAVLGTAIWLGLSWYYLGRMENYESRIKLRDDQILDYKRKLEGLSPDEVKIKIDHLKSLLTPWPEPYHPTPVSGQRFVNKEILLDGKFYNNNVFENVTFRYNGTTPIQFSNNKISGKIIFSSDNPAIISTLLLTEGMGVTKTKFDIISSGILPQVDMPKINEGLLK